MHGVSERGTESRRTSTFTRSSVVDVSINQFRVFLSPLAHARAPWLQALSSPSSLLRAPPTPTSSSFRVIAFRRGFAASPIARVGLPSSRLFFQYALARLYPGKSADRFQSPFQSPLLASHLLSSLATFIFGFEASGAGSLSLQLALSQLRGLRQPVARLTARSASCLMTLYMVNSFHLTRTPRLAWRSRGHEGQRRWRRSLEIKINTNDRHRGSPFRFK